MGEQAFSFMNQRYLPNTHGWTKVHRRDTRDASIGAISGTLTDPNS
ncbi:hypothetical protein [Streptomyces sp. NPDC058623]